MMSGQAAEPSGQGGHPIAQGGRVGAADRGIGLEQFCRDREIVLLESNDSGRQLVECVRQHQQGR